MPTKATAGTEPETQKPKDRKGFEDVRIFEDKTRRDEKLRNFKGTTNSSQSERTSTTRELEMLSKRAENCQEKHTSEEEEKRTRKTEQHRKTKYNTGKQTNPKKRLEGGRHAPL